MRIILNITALFSFLEESIRSIIIDNTHLDIISIQVEPVVFIVEDLGRVLVPSIASHVISQHENYPLIRYS